MKIKKQIVATIGIMNEIEAEIDGQLIEHWLVLGRSKKRSWETWINPRQNKQAVINTANGLKGETKLVKIMLPALGASQ